MIPAGNLSLLLARRRAEKLPIRNIKQLTDAANVSRYMLDRLDDGTLALLHIENIKRVGKTLGLNSLGILLGQIAEKRFQQPCTRPLTIAAQSKRISIRQLAKQMDSSRQSIINIDMAVATYIHVHQLFQLCELLELSIDDVLQYFPLSD